MNDHVEKRYKLVVMAVVAQNLTGETKKKKTPVKIQKFWAEIQTSSLQNMKQEH
jgi:hypothetical protein